MCPDHGDLPALGSVIDMFGLGGGGYKTVLHVCKKRVTCLPRLVRTSVCITVKCEDYNVIISSPWRRRVRGIMGYYSVYIM